MQDLMFRAMGSQIRILLDTDDTQAAPSIDRVTRWFADWEHTLSRFQPDSELSQLNRNAGRWVGVSDVLWEVIQLALDVAHHSNGLVTPTILPALEQIGYGQSIAFSSNQSKQPDHPHIRPAWTSDLHDWWQLRLDTDRRAIWVPLGIRLDLGGIAKGWAAYQTQQRLQPYAPTLVDAGGDIVVSGPQADGSAWPIGVTNPHDPDEILTLLMIAHGSVATSGRDYRRWQSQGIWHHHIIDSRTGISAQSDILSATVVAPDIVRAEMSAKMALILGSAEGLGMLEAQPDLAGLLVLEDGTILQSNRLEQYVWKG